MTAAWPLHAHLVGVGGAGMSGAARLLAARGVTVTGSDGSPGPGVYAVRASGIPVALGHREENLPPEATLVVRSLAVPDENPEVAAALRRGLDVISYPQLLGRFVSEKIGIAVAGTHGKTTTSGMIAHTLVSAGRDPGVMIGGEVATIGGSSRAGRGDFFVAEACEYRRAFRALKPHVAVITSIEEDHLDYYKDLAEIEQAFGEFAAALPRDGMLVANADDAAVMRVLVRAASSRVWTYGLDVPGAVTARVKLLHRERVEFELCQEGQAVGEVALRVPGRHNVSNACGAAAACLAVGVSPSEVCAGLSTYPGARRRFEVVGEAGGVIVVDDYAHHPTAVRVVLQAARQRFPLRRIVAVFQPHQGNRTRHLLRDFARALAMGDRVILPEIYFVRESVEERRKISSADLAREIQRLGMGAEYVEHASDLFPTVVRELRAGDVAVVMGAGDIAGFAQKLVGALRVRAARAGTRMAGPPAPELPRMFEPQAAAEN